MNKRKSDDTGLGDDPFESPLLETLYQRPMPAASEPHEKPVRATRGRGHRRPLADGQTFRLVTFSFYEDDVELLDRLLEEAKKLGIRGASRSLILRLALRQVDLDGLKERI
jgi:hypothetical protein